jgi:hypothetical protein
VARFASVVKEEMHSAFVVLAGIALTLVPRTDPRSCAERVSLTAKFQRRDGD